MKLRIRGDSLRLRLTQTEVDALASSHGRVEESIAFGGASSALTYAITCGGARLSATCTGARIEIAVPTAVAHAWATSDEVSLAATQDAGDGRTLEILVEKDFACLTTRPNEDDRDAFPNPNASCG